MSAWTTFEVGVAGLGATVDSKSWDVLVKLSVFEVNLAISLDMDEISEMANFSEKEEISF